MLVAELNDGRMLRTGRHKYVMYNRAAQISEFLFDLQADPGERQDIAPLARSAPELNLCRRLLEQWMQRTGGSLERTRTKAA